MRYYYETLKYELSTVQYRGELGSRNPEISLNDTLNLAYGPQKRSQKIEVPDRLTGASSKILFLEASFYRPERTAALLHIFKKMFFEKLKCG